MTTTDDPFVFLAPGHSVDRACSIYMRRWSLITRLALIEVIPQIMLTLSLKKTLVLATSQWIVPNMNDIWNSMSTMRIVLLSIEYALCCLSGIIVQAAIIQVVIEYYANKYSSFKASLRLAFDRFGAILCFKLLYVTALLIVSIAVGGSLYYLLLLHNFARVDGLAFVALLIILTASAIVAYVILSLAVGLPIIMVEKRSSIGALKRSFELVSGYRCYIFCSICLMSLLVGIGVVIYRIMVGFMFGFSFFGAVFYALSALVTLPLQTILTNILYFSLRVRKEGLNGETLAGEMEENNRGIGNYNNVSIEEADCEAPYL
ncbi:hypothetical protein FisN_22Lh180 [Fistulifera solaris]|uniref:Glycerophosphoryl diester phosphodiesterase membrane domain-containing protein n=1 Tax=Fistulifera solaris TaxID=1519565 RepID=A0A1Z5JC04_FISSO|nr:hypothetical protein FisN_22Lh180 [Fistulifera solaris]|eukprot:GAX11489.1 hypothetical protein FisN_22Lh180 [Fistulifera solaris]